MRSLLVYSNDHVGSTMSGPGIRAYHFARELAREFQVTLMAPNAVDVTLDGVEVAPPVAPDDIARTAARFDAVVAQYLPLAAMRRLARSDVRVVYDVYVPLLGEYLAMPDATAIGIEGSVSSNARLSRRAMPSSVRGSGSATTGSACLPDSAGSTLTPTAGTPRFAT